MNKYILICRYCGTTLMKTNEPVLAVLKVEIKCPNPNCKKLLRIPKDIKVVIEKPRKFTPGIEK